MFFYFGFYFLYYDLCFDLFLVFDISCSFVRSFVFLLFSFVPFFARLDRFEQKRSFRKFESVWRNCGAIVVRSHLFGIPFSGCVLDGPRPRTDQPREL